MQEVSMFLKLLGNSFSLYWNLSVEAVTQIEAWNPLALGNFELKFQEPESLISIEYTNL